MKTQKETSSHALPEDQQTLTSMNPSSENAETISTKQDRTDPTLYLQAQQFALAILADPVLKDLYTKMAGSRCTAYSLALSEFLALREQGQWIF